MPIQVRQGEKAAVVLSGGNPRIAKADGDAPVQAYIAGMPGWKCDLGKRLDALIVRTVPNVRKAFSGLDPDQPRGATPSGELVISRACRLALRTQSHVATNAILKMPI
jgi:hypothetical protein